MRRKEKGQQSCYISVGRAGCLVCAFLYFINECGGIETKKICCPVEGIPIITGLKL